MLTARRQFLRPGAVIALLVIVFLTNLSAQTLELQSRKRESIFFKFIKNLIVVPLNINGKGPFNFVLDTGVGLFLITDPTLVDSLAVENLRSIQITGFGEGSDLSAYVTPGVDVSVGENISGRLPAAILKADKFHLSEYAGMPIHGLIGYEFFSSFIVRIDYDQTLLTVFRNETAFIPRKGYKVPLIIQDRKPYLVSEISLDKTHTVPAMLIVDSGAGHPVSLETYDRKPFPQTEKHINANLGVGLTGPINGSLGRIHAMKIGRFDLKNVIAAFPDYKDVGSKIASGNRNGNMGNSILKRFVVVFDYSRTALYLRPSGKYFESFEHDMSGMELLCDGRDYDRIIISRVEQGSAADEVGLVEGDEIVSINLRPVRELSIDQMDELFRSRHDRSIILGIVPKGEKNIERVIITLKRRI